MIKEWLTQSVAVGAAAGGGLVLSSNPVSFLLLLVSSSGSSLSSSSWLLRHKENVLNVSLTVQNQIGPIAEVPSESLGKGNCFTHEIPRKVSSAQPDAKDYQTSDETTP